MFSEASVSHSVHRGVCLMRGVCLQEDLPGGSVIQEGLPPGGVCHPEGSAYTGVCIQGVCIQGVCLQGGSASRGRGSASKGEGVCIKGGSVHPHCDIYWWPLQQSVCILLECFFVGN